MSNPLHQLRRLWPIVLALVLLPPLLIPAYTAPPEQNPIVPTRPRVSLPLLANERPTATPHSQPTATLAPGAPTPAVGDCSTDPNPADAPNTPIAIVTIEKTSRPEVAVLRNVSAASVVLAGWRLCSINGNQEHTLGSITIGPGETVRIPYTGGNIWNNTERDDAALYDASGRLAAYWIDV